MLMNILIALAMAIVGYFLGIFKERSNIKWRERREALKELFYEGSGGRIFIL